MELGQRVTDVDVVIWVGETLYLVECKHSIPFQVSVDHDSIARKMHCVN